MLVDASVARNFAVLGWVRPLVALCGGSIRLAHGILGLDPDEPGELDGIRAAFQREAERGPVGSSTVSRATAALVGLDELIALRSSELEVVEPTDDENILARRLMDREHRDWRRSLGMRARRLDAGEAVSVAIAVTRGEIFVCDEADGRTAYLALGGRDCPDTLDLVQQGVERGILTAAEAREGYERLRVHYRFGGPVRDG